MPPPKKKIKVGYVYALIFFIALSGNISKLKNIPIHIINIYFHVKYSNWYINMCKIIISTWNFFMGHPVELGSLFCS